MARRESPFGYVKTVGGLLPSELLQRVLALDKELGGLEADDYHLVGERIPEAISRSWGRMLAVWANFRAAWAGLPPGDAATGLTRDKLLLPLFGELGYGRLPLARGLEVEGKAYPISHLWNGVPIHLVGAGVDLDRRTPGAVGAARQSPHGLVQEYLNRSEALWGFVANGLKLRLLRDNAAITRQAYVEFDLEAIFEAEAYPDFALLWLLAHESRVYSEGKPPSGCWLERWQEKGAEQGKRALGRLRDGVREAILHLGRGFLKHPANTGLKAALRSGSLTPQGYYRELLRLVYRLLFLFVAEDRDVLLERAPEGAPPEEREALEQARRTYTEHYSTARLRRIAERVTGTRHPDLYHQHRLIAGFLNEKGASQLALKPLNSMLFDPQATPHLFQAELANRDFLEAIRSLAFTQDDSTLRPVDYKNLGAEELGSVYEQLLELVPEVDVGAAHFALQSLSGNERKTSGSYYTPTSLIEVVLDEALNPKLEEALQQARRLPPDQREKPILALKVVDPAVGSGHFLIAAAHRIAKVLAQLRSGEDEPSPEALRSALRDVIRNCLYGVDTNEMSAELCKVALWMEMAEPGKPLGFLDHHIKVGNSLIGAPPGFYELGIPAEAHKREDVPDMARNLSKALGKKALEKWRSEDHRLFKEPLRVPPLDAPEDSLEQVRSKAQAYREWRQSEAVRKYEFLADYWTAAWFARPRAGQKLPDMEGLITLAEEQFNRLGADELRHRSGLAEPIDEAKGRYQFFHWWLEFAEVFFDRETGELKPGGGFDVVLGNPPWERVKLQEKEFFAGRHEKIAQAENAARRKKLIDELKESDPALYAAFQEALNAAENVSNFLRTSGRYPLTGGGDVNTYQVFAEHGRTLGSTGAWVGIIIQSDIATADSNKVFFEDLLGRNQLACLLDFVNLENLFPGLHRTHPHFCVFVLNLRGVSKGTRFSFYNTNIGHLDDPERQFILSHEDFQLLNPNTLTCPVFRTRADAELTKKIYRRVPVLVEEGRGEAGNPWGIKFQAMFHMSNDSGLFKTRGSLEHEGYRLVGNRMVNEGSVYLPLYEAKLIWHFDHRFATYDGEDTRDMTPAEHASPEALPLPRYWVPAQEVEERLVQKDRNGNVVWEWKRGWLMGFRNITNATNERTAIFSLMPRGGVGHSSPLLASEKNAPLQLALLANMSAYVLDFSARQKIGGINLTYNYLRQFPVLPPSAYKPQDLHFIVPRVLELTYTAWDLAPFAQDVWDEAEESLRALLRQQWESNGGHPPNRPSWLESAYPFPPFRWDEERRALLRAELDAYYARLYGLTREELCYILDPQSVKGPSFPGETFRVLKEKEIKAYGEYRTMRLVLEAWDRIAHIDSEVRKS